MALEAIKGKIIEVSQEDISNEEKFKKVFDYIRAELNMEHIKDSLVNLLIELAVNRLKAKNII